MWLLREGADKGLLDPAWSSTTSPTVAEAATALYQARLNSLWRFVLDD